MIGTPVGIVRVNQDASMVSAATATTPVATPTAATQVLQDHDTVFVPETWRDDKMLSSTISDTTINTEDQLDLDSDDNTIEAPHSDTPSKDPIQPLPDFVELNVPESDTLDDDLISREEEDALLRDDGSQTSVAMQSGTAPPPADNLNTDSTLADKTHAADPACSKPKIKHRSAD